MYYYVPIEQIKKGQDITDIDTYMGPAPYTSDYTENRIIRNFYDFCLIVYYNKTHNPDTATEIMTGQQIPVLTTRVILKEDESEEIKYPNTKDIHTYIRNALVTLENREIYPGVFSKQNCLGEMDYWQAKHILEVYKIRYKKKQLEKILAELFKQGQEIYFQAQQSLTKELEDSQNQTINILRLIDEIEKSS